MKSTPKDPSLGTLPRMRALIRLVASLALGGVAAACGPAEGPGGGREGDAALRGTLVITGSSTVAPLVAEMGRRFEASHPGVRVDIQTGGSSRGISDLRRGLAAVAMISRPLADEEMDLVAYPVAVDAVGFVVHRDNSVPFLDKDAVRAIFTGQMRDWSEVGGRPGRIVVVHKAEGRGTLELFLHTFGLGQGDVRPDVIVGDNQHGIKTVAGSRAAIGYVSVGAVEEEVAGGTPVRLVPLGGASAKEAPVAGEGSPMTRTLDLVTGPAPAPLVGAFLEFARSPAVEDLVRGLRFIPPSR
jgi:phosphate transport system substrate-binding protein